MSDAYNDGDVAGYSVAGAHGTIAPVQDEAYYDDRSDADDDMEKGRLNFPNVIYGRERELERLHNIYAAMVKGKGSGEKKDDAAAEEKLDNSSEHDDPPSCIFLGGYSGVGKSALVKEYIRRMQGTYRRSGGSPVLHATGKYGEQKTASAPFSAISEVLESLAVEILGRIDSEEVGKSTSNNELVSKIQKNIKQSDLIGPGTEGNRILLKTFPVLDTLLDSCEDASTCGKPDDENKPALHASMNALKECTNAVFSAICEAVDYPVVVFLDDLQWADVPFFDLLLFLLTSTKLKQYVIFICAYRSNEVGEDHSLMKLMADIPTSSFERIDLFSLSLDAVTRFIADSVKSEDEAAVAELAEAVYTKTMGNIFFVMQALEELVRKNVLFYDVMCFEWRWVVSKAELSDFMSGDVVDSVKGKIRELPKDIQQLLVVMAYIPHNTLEVSLLEVLMSHGEKSFGEAEVEALLRQASEEGLLISSSNIKSCKFAHDRIRQAAYEIAVQANEDHQLPLHIAHVLMDFAQGSKTEWCLYVAVDILNSLPPEKTSRSDLISLNLRVARIAKSRGAMEKENELLRKGLKCLIASGINWKGKFYSMTLELYDAAIVSEYSLGNYESAKKNIDTVLRNACSLDDKLNAYLHQLQCQMNETSDYAKGALDGVTVLNMYGFDIPSKLTKPYLTKEEMKLKVALRGRSFMSLADLPLCPSKDNPLFHLCCFVQSWSSFSGKEDLHQVVTLKAVRTAIKRGMGRHLPAIVGSYANSLAKNGKIGAAQEYGQVALALADKVRHDVEVYTFAMMVTHAGTIGMQHPFHASVDTLLQSHKDSNLIGGDVMVTIGCLLGYFQAYFASGLELGPLLESKLILAEECSRKLDRPGFLAAFRILRQSMLNLRVRTTSPTSLDGEAFKEEDELKGMNDSARKMTLRDSSSFRVMLAVVYWNEDVMAQMLNILKDYPLKDIFVPRLHNRLAFTGLAALALCRRDGGEEFAKLGKDCLNYFAHLTKHGSVNAKPVHLLMLAMKNPNKEAFQKAIEACAEADMIHLEAIAQERYAAFLVGENDDIGNRDCIISSYWLYQDWGAHAKALQLSKQYGFLKNTSRKKASSLTLSLEASEHSSKAAKGDVVAQYNFNTTFRRGSRLFVKR